MTTIPRLLLPLLLLLIGVALMAYMIVAEGELGAVPLLIVIAGAGWTCIALLRKRV
jgi:hypothetical protein